MKSIPILVFIFLIISCQEQENTINKFSDKTLVEIYELKDKRDTKSLLIFFDNKNPVYRQESALAFGSIQDTLALPRLYELLSDKEAKVRLASAFAIGQTAHISSKEILKNQLEREYSGQVIHELLIAYGSSTDSSGLDYLHSYNYKSDLVAEGKAWGLYRAGLNKNTSELGTIEALKLLNHSNSKVQLAASNYFARVSISNIGSNEKGLFKALEIVSDSEVKMNLVRAVGKIKSKQAQLKLLELLTSDNNDLLMVNVLRALDVKYEVNYIARLKELVLSRNPQVAITATIVLLKSNNVGVEEIQNLISKTTNNRVKAVLYEEMAEILGDKVTQEIIDEYSSSSNNYYKGDLLKALPKDETQLGFIADITFNTDVAYLKTSGITALQNIFVRGYASKRVMANYFKQAIESKDIGLIYAASQTLSDTTNGLKNQYENFDFLYKAKNSLTLPIDAEAMIAIQGVIDVYEENFNGAKFNNPYNNPIDWKHVKSIPRDQKVILHTIKGDITWQLNVEESPGTTEFFLRLVKKGFYDGLNFHRVVPNFVAQGGCPRGDGFGGTPESIRSEFGLSRYKTGSVGVASAGKDTESCQFFMTHSPTPHLNGRYTIFAEVIKGMDVMQTLDLGDEILSIEIVK